LTFGTWCDRNYGFEYDDVRAHKGIAWFPIVTGDTLQWIRNENYRKSELQCTEVRVYPEFSLEQDKSVYTQFKENNDKFLFVTRPDLFKDSWKITR
jgi:glucose-6-phosphate isomerase